MRLTGLLSEVAESETIVLITHGLSGNAMSPYCALAASAAARAGFSSLRLSLRGADYSGKDILHGGITQDLWAALAAPEIARYRRVLLLGYSVGGHIVLWAAVEQVDERVRAAAAICLLLDLDRATVTFDHPALTLAEYTLNCARDFHEGLRIAQQRYFDWPSVFLEEVRGQRKSDAVSGN